MRYEYETIVRLKVLSVVLTPEQITKELGIACDKSWLAGNTRAHTIIKETTNGWILDSGLPPTLPLEAQLETFLKRLMLYSLKIRTLSMHSTVELSCVIYARTPPPLYFSSSIIFSLAELGASFDIDLYMLGE